jgi:hypothetical protein
MNRARRGCPEGLKAAETGRRATAPITMRLPAAYQPCGIT